MSHVVLIDVPRTGTTGDQSSTLMAGTTRARGGRGRSDKLREYTDENGQKVVVVEYPKVKADTCYGNCHISDFGLFSLLQFQA